MYLKCTCTLIRTYADAGPSDSTTQRTKVTRNTASRALVLFNSAATSVSRRVDEVGIFFVR